MKRFAALLPVFLTACASDPLIPNASIEVLPEVTVSTHQVVGSAAAGLAARTIGTKALSTVAGVTVSSSVATLIGIGIYLIYDPLAPNWEIKEQRLADDTYRLDLRMKRYHTGGQGEAMQVLRRRAAALQAQGGFRDFQVVEYAEGIESKTFGAHRYAEARLKLIRG
jgi:hypothetical protein